MKRIALLVFLQFSLTGMAITLVNDDFSRGAMIKSVQSEEIPAGWTYYLWHSKLDGPHGGLTRNNPATPPYSLEVPVVKEGMGGWYSTYSLLRPFAPLTVTFKYRISEDYAGNVPCVFISWLDAKKTFIKPLYCDIPGNVKKGVWLDFKREIKSEEIPANAEFFNINLTSKVNAEKKTPTGNVSYDQVTVSVPPSLAAELRLRGTSKGNWWTVGEPVVFTAQGAPAAQYIAIRGTVFDSDNKEIISVSVPAAQFRLSGWSWKPEQPGFYQIEFLAEQDGKMVPLAEEFAEYAWISSRIGIFRRNRVDVAVVPKQDKFQVADMFGFQLACTPSAMKSIKDEEILLAKKIGAKFMRAHVEWFAIEPKKGEYNWECFDYYVNKCIENGIEPVICFYGTPQWASSRPDDKRYVVHVNAYCGYKAKEIKDWEDFISVMVLRYKNKVKTWEVWNEPHLPGFSCYWLDSPENFVIMLKAAYETIKKVQPESTVWLGGIGMRYQSFYDEIIKQGAGRYFDSLALHGFDVNPEPFYQIDRRNQSPVHPWVNSEWHANLLRYGDDAYNLNEKERALRMLMDLLRQVKSGVQQVSFFELRNLSEREALAFFTASGMSLNHSSGLFHRLPYIQPVFGAVAMHNFTHRFSGKIKFVAEYLFEKQKAVLLSDSQGLMLIFWQESKNPQPIAQSLSNVLGNAPVISWEGRQLSASRLLESHCMYFSRIVSPPDKLIKTDNVLRMERMPLKLGGPTATYTINPLFDADGEFISANAIWTEKDWQKKFWATPSGNNSARFAVAISNDFFDLAVEVVDPIHNPAPKNGSLWGGDSIQLAFDTLGKGYADDRCEFSAAATSAGTAIVKESAPSLVGDIPVDWTPACGTVKTGFLKFKEFDNGKKLYLLRLKLSELYPMVLKPGDPIRFSLLVNDNNGNERTGWLNWGDGIGDAKKPVQYGTILPATEK